MKLNNNPKKRSNFFLKISACAMLICVMLAVFILPSSAEVPDVGSTITFTSNGQEYTATYGGDNVHPLYGDAMYYHVVTQYSTVYSGRPINLVNYGDPGGELYISNLNKKTVLSTYNNDLSNWACSVSGDNTGDNTLRGIFTVQESGTNNVAVIKQSLTFDCVDVDNVNIGYTAIGEGVNHLLFDNATITVYNIPAEPSPIDTILGVFLGISEWLGDALLAIIPAFWTGEELTVLGVLAVSGLAIAITLLLINWIRNLLNFGG